MPVKVIRPITPGQRHSIVDTYEDVTTNRPFKSLVGWAKKRNGRNNRGMITVRHRGGGNTRKYRVVDFKQDKFDIPAVVETIEYDPNRSARIALIKYNDGERRYILSPEGLKVGDVVLSSTSQLEAKLGNRMPLKFMPEGAIVCNVELSPLQGGVLSRSAGTVVQVMAIEGKYALLKMPSSEIRKVLKDCLATLGQASNIDHHLISVGKAGTNRKRGKRPEVRGKVMNPCDHPHGGGQGKNPIGLVHPKTIWGKNARGVKSRNRNKYSSKLIVKRRSKE